MKKDDFEYLKGDNTESLLGAIADTKYIDVKKEIKQLREKCEELNINFFDHSMQAIQFFDYSLQAINYLKEREKVPN